jgi:hypothetical protein
MVKTWKDSGMGPADIAAKWNHGSETGWENLQGSRTINGQVVKYDTPTYVKNTVANFKQIYPQVEQQYGQPQQTQQQQTEQPWSVGGFVQNAASSAGNLVGGLANAVMHPIDTLSGLASTVAGAGETATNKLGLTNFNNQDTQNFGHIVDYFGERYGGSSPSEVIHNIGHTLYQDPVGAALDLSMFLDAGASAVGKIGKISDIAEATKLSQAADFISTTAGIMKGGSPEAIQALQTPGTITKIADAMRTIGDYTNPITGAVNVTKKTLGLGGKVGMGIGSKIIGESPELLIDLVKNPQDYSKAAMEVNSRGGLANEFGNAIDKIETAKSTTGAEYGAIRNSKIPVTISEDSIIQAFADNGLNVTKNGKGEWVISAPTADTTLSKADTAHFKDFLDQYGKTEMDSNQFLNARAKLSEYSKYEGKTDGSTKLARDLRGVYDEMGKSQIQGLGELDAKMAPQLQEWKGIKKEFLQRDVVTGDWVLKPNTASKLANALKAGKEPLLAKLEEIIPGITRKIEILKNVEEIENSLGIKVGTYTKSGLEIGGIVTGNIPLAVSMIIAHPSIANQILRGLGFVGKTAVTPVLEKVRALTGLLPEGSIGTATKAAVINNEATNYTPPSK